MTPKDRSLDVESVCRLLAEEERHRIVKYLKDRDQVFVDEIVAEVAEQGVQNREFRIRLIHVHLPKLADVGVVSYNPSTEQVVPMDVDRVAGALDAIKETI